MSTATLPSWKPGSDLPYVIPLGDGSMLVIKLIAQWVKADRSGEPLLLPPAVRAIDRLRAVFAAQERLTPGFILSLREAMQLTQSEFAARLGVSKMTVSRWECGRMRPSVEMREAISKLQERARLEGVRIDGKKRTAGR